jgi:hypothetical protein
MLTMIGVILKLSIANYELRLYAPSNVFSPKLDRRSNARTRIEPVLTGVFSKLTMAATPPREERRGGELGFSRNRRDRPMRIGTIGAGEVALAVAREALARGHEVVLSSRSGPSALADKVTGLGRGASAATVEEAASLDYVLLAVPWKNVEATLRGLPEWNGRVLIDATNPFAETSPNLVLADLGGIGASEIVAGFARGGADRQGVQFHPYGPFQRGADQGPRQARDLCLG